MFPDVRVADLLKAGAAGCRKTKELWHTATRFDLVKTEELLTTTNGLKLNREVPGGRLERVPTIKARQNMSY